MVLQFLKKRLIPFGIQWLGAWAIVLGCTLFCTPAHSEEPIVVIVNETGPLTHISPTEVREIYLGEIKFVDGIRIVPVNSPEGPIKDSFLSRVVGKTSKAYKLHWIKKVFQEGLNIPSVKVNPHEIIEWISKEPGAIGYVPKNLVENAQNVRIIHIF